MQKCQTTKKQATYRSYPLQLLGWVSPYSLVSVRFHSRLSRTYTTPLMRRKSRSWRNLILCSSKNGLRMKNCNGCSMMSRVSRKALTTSSQPAVDTQVKTQSATRHLRTPFGKLTSHASKVNWKLSRESWLYFKPVINGHKSSMLKWLALVFIPAGLVLGMLLLWWVKASAATDGWY